MRAYPHARENNTHRGDDRVVVQETPFLHIAGWVWIVRQHDVREDPHEIANSGLMTDVNVAMRTDVITNRAVALDVAQRPNLQVLPRFCKFPDRD